MREIFITGGTGYIGRPLITELLVRGHILRALVRGGSEGKLPTGVTTVFGNALDAGSFASAVPPADTFVHLIGTPRPNPTKAQQFRKIDLVSVKAAVAAAISASVQHIVYVSVAQPAPTMRAYVNVRAEGEALIRASRLNATILRPWYVLGQRHRWPYLLMPVYVLLKQLPATRASALRLGLITLPQMLAALVRAVEQPAEGVRIVEVPEICSGPDA